MIELPILFSGPMVRAILDGSKTQTRRVMKLSDEAANVLTDTRIPPVTMHPHGMPDAKTRARWDLGAGGAWNAWCPYGQPGGRLWVREPLYRGKWEGMANGAIYYRADDEPAWDVNQPCVWPWKPKSLGARYCPRGCSRIDLEVTGVRVERVQEISYEDCRDEGVECPIHGTTRHVACSGLRTGFAELWDSINAKRGYGWKSNCWVWVVEFLRARP